VVLGLLVQKLDANKYLIIPTIILLAVNVTTIIYAVLATRPKITEGVFTREQVEEKSVNLIFFGNFYKMDFEEYDFGVTQMMEDRDFLYRSLEKTFMARGKFWAEIPVIAHFVHCFYVRYCSISNSICNSSAI
jgi:hypothetical protein